MLARSSNRPRVVFLNRSYWPDAEATGQLLTELCEDLAEEYEVCVAAGQPNQNPEGFSFRRWGRQVQRGVNIDRVWHTRFSKASLTGRAINLLTYWMMAACVTMRMDRPAAIVVQTDPPILCLLGALLRRRHRCRLIVYLQDIYPDLAVALGKLSDSWLTRCLRNLMFGVYRQADRVVVLSADMQDVLLAAGVSPRRIVTVPNWTDTRCIVPQKSENAFRAQHSPAGQFLVMYSGNLGLSQQLDEVLQAAHLLRRRADIQFLLVGDGVSKARLRQLAQDLQLSNVRFLDYQPKSGLSASLSAADLHLVPLDPRIKNYLMPSKLYGILASQTPLIAVAPRDCELARFVESEGVGFVVSPGDSAALAERIESCADHREPLLAMGRAARRVAVDHFDRKLCTARFGNLLGETLGRI